MVRRTETPLKCLVWVLPMSKYLLVQMECWNALELLVWNSGADRRFDSLLIDAGSVGDFLQYLGYF